MEDDVASTLISLAVQLAFEVRRRRRVCVCMSVMNHQYPGKSRRQPQFVVSSAYLVLVT